MPIYTYIKTPVDTEQLANEIRTVTGVVLITYDSTPMDGGIQWNSTTSTVTIETTIALAPAVEVNVAATVSAHVPSNTYVSPFLSTVGSSVNQITFSVSSPIIGSKAWVKVPYNCVINNWDITADTIGSAVVSVKKSNAGGFGTGGTVISGTQKPTLATQQISSSSTLTTWNREITEGDYLFFNVDSVSAINSLVVNLIIQKID